MHADKDGVAANRAPPTETEGRVSGGGESASDVRARATRLASERRGEELGRRPVARRAEQECSRPGSEGAGLCNTLVS